MNPKFASEHILIQNYHPTATAALIRDFKRLGMTVYAPDSDWGRISYFADNGGLGAELVGLDTFLSLKPSYILLACKPQEADMLRLAREHGDRLILNVAQHLFDYEAGSGQIMLCPDLQTIENYPSLVRRKLLYLLRPTVSDGPGKDVDASFAAKEAASFISMPSFWPAGTAAFEDFSAKYPFSSEMFGIETPSGLLNHRQTCEKMARSFFTVHFKELEAYGFSCIESMLIGTPVVSLKRFMDDKTLGRLFLDSSNSVVVDTVDEAVRRLTTMTLDEYRLMSVLARTRALALTDDHNNVDRLRSAIEDENAVQGWPADVPGAAA